MMERNRKPERGRVGRWVTAAAVGMTAAGPAPAFYFDGWPGSGVSAPQTLLRTGAPLISEAPAGALVRPPRGVTPSGPDPDQNVGYDSIQRIPGVPNQGDLLQSPAISDPATPEPATVVSVAAGLAALGAMKLRRRKRA